ncbi:hypothetical protein BDY17DRAFT_6331 [Neohortaea acidophila]|uniref:Uncharacterized protein n=1 Tax=Neohortaea acidophila TaxID=245834 RepID=A0A6A6Q5H5_9PEZI|nr:uncharacterized protein BDY17DRAFT_6331 [Neohortaea acidophila]KAF2487224.1 hypothetical protein BDY17DRAFT_6331 [Neohortaea acidophila]
MRLLHVLPTLLSLASLASLVSAAAVKSSSTTCPKPTTCPVSTTIVTKTTSGKNAVTKTITVHQTVTASASPTTTTITATTDLDYSAAAYVTTTFTLTVTPTTTVTSYSNAASTPPPEKRDVHRRATKCPAVKACTTSVSTFTTTFTSAKATSTVTVISKKTITTTPTVTATATITSSSVTTVEMTSTITSTATASTTTSTATVTYSSFYITASDSAVVSDGTTLEDQYSSSTAEGTSVFNGGGTVLALYGGTLYDTEHDALASYDFAEPTDLVFLGEVKARETSQCLCQIDSFTLVLSCNCNGNSVFQTDSNGEVHLDTQVDSGNYAITPVIQPILD